MKRGAAKLVGHFNIQIDRDIVGKFGGIGTGYLPWIGQQSRHFDRLIGGRDTRLRWHDDELTNAISFCTNPQPKNRLQRNPDEVFAAFFLGASLHSIQDWWAHGDYSKGTSDTFNAHGKKYDTWGLDAVGTRDGKTPINGRAPKLLEYVIIASRAGIAGITREIDWPHWSFGTLRSSGTKEDSRDTIREFMDEVRKNGSCDCKKFFLRRP